MYGMSNNQGHGMSKDQVLFERWTSGEEDKELLNDLSPPKPSEDAQFRRRKAPILEAFLHSLKNFKTEAWKVVSGYNMNLEAMEGIANDMFAESSASCEERLRINLRNMPRNVRDLGKEATLYHRYLTLTIAGEVEKTLNSKRHTVEQYLESAFVLMFGAEMASRRCIMSKTTLKQASDNCLKMLEERKRKIAEAKTRQRRVRSTNVLCMDDLGLT